MTASAPAPGVETQATAKRFSEEDDAPSHNRLPRPKQPSFEALYSATVVQRRAAGFRIGTIAAELGLTSGAVERILWLAGRP